MKYRKLSDSDLEVSEISLGSWQSCGVGVMQKGPVCTSIGKWWRCRRAFSRRFQACIASFAPTVSVKSCVGTLGQRVGLVVAAFICLAAAAAGAPAES